MVLEKLGPIPLTSITAPGSVTGYGPDGTPRIYWVASGVQSTLNIIDARSGERIDTLALPAGTGGSWSLDRQDNGDIYIATYGEGHLVKYELATHRIIDLGQPAAGETFLWAVSHDDSTGIVYAASGQIGGHLISHDPRTGTDRDYGAFTEDPASPLIGHAVAAAEGTAWIGLGPVPRLFEVDAATGHRTEIPLPGLTVDDKYVGELDVRGNLLFVRMQQTGVLHVYDWRTGRWVAELDRVMGLTMSETSPDGDHVHFMRPGELWRFNLGSHRVDKVVDVDGFSDVRAFGYLRLGGPEWPGHTLVGSNYQGGYFLWNHARRLQVQQGDVQGSYASIRSMAEGPDGKVYFSGYLAGGLASHDPVTGANAEVSEAPGQGESMTSHAGALWIGTYPDAGIWRYRPGADREPERVARFDGDGQSRPVGMAAAGRLLAVALVPANGTRGGGLGLVDIETAATEFHAIVPGHSVVKVAHRDGIIYGSTSIFGGVGASRPPAEDDSGCLFAYDVATRSVKWQVKPHDGDGVIGSVAFDRDGNLWTSSPMTIFKMDPADGTVLASANFGSYPWDSISYVWGGGEPWINPYEDRIYWNSQGSIWVIDPTTLERARYFRPSAHAFMGNGGYDYVARSLDSWRWRMEPRPATRLTIDQVDGSATAIAAGLGAAEPVELFGAGGRSLGLYEAGADGSLTVGVADPDTADLQLVRPMSRGVVWHR